MKRKINRLFILISVSIFLTSLVSASSLECSLVPHYYSGGYEINNDNSTEINAVSFGIEVKNLDSKQRMLSLSIINYSSNFKNYLPQNTIEYLRIQDSKILWNSELIPSSNLNNTETFSLSIIALSETDYLLQNCTTSKTVNIRKGENLILLIGGTILPSNPIGGFFILILGISLIIFFAWKNEIGKRFDTWRIKQKRDKLNERKRDYYENN